MPTTMGGAKSEASFRRADLSRALKAVRRRRGVRTADLAQALGMAERTYVHFESGRSRINVERIHQVARVLNVDPLAILAAVDLASPEFAVRTADNKLMTILAMALKDFDTLAGDQMAQLDARTLMDAFERVFQELAAIAKDRCEVAEKWRRRNPPIRGEG